MATTTNFGWETPDDTDLVKDGALAIRTLGSAIDTSLVDLKGGTTGQVLSKTSNTDMDFTWINNDQGDITAVTAGTGLTGGGTSGAVTVSLSSPVSATLGGTAQTTYTTGDLLFASATDTLSKRAIGTTGQVLTVSGGVPTWASPAGGGKVLQVVQDVSTATESTTSSSYTDTTLSIAITPSSTSSKILVIFTGNGKVEKNGTDEVKGMYQLVRGASAIASTQLGVAAGSANLNSDTTVGLTFLDSPNTTSATTYKVQMRRETAATTTVYLNANTTTSTLTLIEIGA